MDEVHIVAQIILQADYREQFLSIMNDVVPASRSETGNIRYDLTEDVNNPLSLMIIELWDSLQAIEDHNNTPHYKKLAAFFSKGPATLSVTRLKQII